MKKDKEWIYKEVDKLRIYTNPDIPTRLDDFYGQYLQYVSGVNSTAEEVLGLINQLDEPEGLSQELPVIPKYVADWVVRYREKYDLYPALRLLENNTLVWGEIYEWYRMNTHKFVNAYLTGEYEVEEEPKYYVLDSEDIPLLEKVGNQVQKATSELSIYEKGRANTRFKLAEQEIKNYDERFWPFAKPVE